MIVIGARTMFESLPAISLDDLVREAALTIRMDHKYIVPVEAAGTVLGALDDARVLEIAGRRAFEYDTTYFDTADLDLYTAALRSRPRRHKVRTRTYVDTALTALEVKKRDGRHRTDKHVMGYAFDDRHRLTDPGRLFVDTITGRWGEASLLRRTLTTRYRRRTLFVASDATRVTVDTDYRCAEPGGGRAQLLDQAIVETKTPGPPGIADHVLWRAGFRPRRISKYGTGLAVALGLHANKWHRTIARYFAS